MKSFVLEGPGGIPGLKQVPNGGSVTTNTNWIFAGNVTVQGTLNSAAESITSEIITTANANALAVGPAGTTNPTFNVDTSTASAATGLNVKSAAAGSRVALTVVSSATNESMSIDAKGTGQIFLNALVAGATGVQVGGSANVGTTTMNVKSSNANALVVGPSGATNPSLNVDASTASAATGLNVKSAAAAAGLALSVISSGTDENLTIDAKGAGSITLAGTSTGGINLNDPTTVTSASASALAVGLNGATNPALLVDASTASSATGLSVKSAAAAGGLAVAVISSGTNEALTLNAKGSGSITVGAVSTGDVVLGSGASNFVNFARGEITSTNATTPSFLTNSVGGAGGPTTGAQHGWLTVRVGGSQRWIPVWL